MKDFLLPDLGEGLTESELVEWHVAVGDVVTLNQTLADVETAKAIVSLPSPFAGRVAKLYVEPGATIAVGAPIVGFETEGESAPSHRTPVLVGYGPDPDSGQRPTRPARNRPLPAEPAEAPPGGTATPTAASVESTDGAGPPRPRSTPPVRKLAHDLGVDLNTIKGTGADGLITRDDVLAVQAEHGQASGTAASDHRPSSAVQASSRRIPIKGVRKHTAAAMVSSAFSAPHATVFLTSDVTGSIQLIERLRATGEQASLLAVVARALCIALHRHRALNSSWDEPAQEIIEYGDVNLGIAVATERGLIVPVIGGAQHLPVGELAAAIAEAAQTARDGSIPQERLSGGTITISNVGVFGVDAGTPILMPGQAAILATGAVRRVPWEHEGAMALREVMTLSLSFDHRLVDGEQAAGLLVDIGRILTDPGTALAM